MLKIQKKYLVYAFMFLQISLSAFIPLAQAAEPNQSTPPPIQSIDTSPNQSNATDPVPPADYSITNTPVNPQCGTTTANPCATSSFSVTKYLSAKDQGQSYLKKDNPIASFVIQIINFLVLTIGSLAFLCLIIGGFILVVSNGAEDLVTKGKEIIKYALIGLVIVLTSYLIVAFVQSIFYELPGKA